MTAPADDLAVALVHHRAGRTAAAEPIYRRILALDPEHPQALHLLGVLLGERGLHREGLASIERAIARNPHEPAFHNSLGNACCEAGQPERAIAAYHEALRLKPDFAEAHNNLGTVLQHRGDLAAAVDHYREALRLKPDYADAHNNLGSAWQAQGRLADAIAAYRRAIELNPAFPAALNNLGNALCDLEQMAEALDCHRRAVQLAPAVAELHTNLGADLRALGRFDEAAACYRRAIELNPAYAVAHNNLGVVHKEQGRLAEAIACYRRALEAAPGHAAAYSNLLYTLNFCPDYDAQAIAAEHRRWHARVAARLTPCASSHPNDRDPERRLRIGYVSGDFRLHPVGRFIRPLLEAHDRERCETFCYASVHVPDEITHRCRAAAEHWRDVPGAADEEVARQIVADRIDILVDLSMHMAGNRLLLFARKPAPVQVSYLAYCGTTGLAAIDYRLTDPFLDPPSHDDGRYSEQSIRLPETYWCYQAADEAPAVAEVPAVRAGRITFGSLNNFGKATPETLDAWCRLLAAVPGSRLLLHSPPGDHREAVRTRLAGQGLSAERLDFVDMLGLADYFRLYDQIDVALDPFPYGGGTTTCDALWMGIPVISLAGRTAVGRGGVSILSNVGLPELVALTADDYVRLAAELANNLPRLAQLRLTLRDRMRRSPLMNAPRFAHNVEAAYRQMWRRWCDAG